MKEKSLLIDKVTEVKVKSIGQNENCSLIFLNTNK